MVETRLPDEILHEIEEDLRQDQDLWKHIHTDLHALGAPSARARPRTRWIVLGAVASVIALFAAFAVGWQTAPGTTEEVAVTRIVTVAPLPGIAEEKYEALAGLHGVPVVAPLPEAAPRRDRPGEARAHRWAPRVPVVELGAAPAEYKDEVLAGPGGAHSSLRPDPRSSVGEAARNRFRGDRRRDEPRDRFRGSFRKATRPREPKSPGPSWIARRQGRPRADEAFGGPST